MLIEYTDKWQAQFLSFPALNPSNLVSGDRVLVKYQAEDKWYRGAYLGMNGRRREIFYEDFGSVESVAEGGLRAVDPNFQVGYEIPTTILSCKLVRPEDHNEYLVLTDEHISLLRSLVDGVAVDVDVLGYEVVNLCGMPRVVLAIDAYNWDGEGIVMT